MFRIKHRQKFQLSLLLVFVVSLLPVEISSASVGQMGHGTVSGLKTLFPFVRDSFVGVETLLSSTGSALVLQVRSSEDLLEPFAYVVAVAASPSTHPKCLSGGPRKRRVNTFAPHPQCLSVFSVESQVCIVDQLE